MAKSLILCNCMGTLPLDGERLSETTGLACSKVYTALCTSQQDQATQAMASGDLILACGQEQSVFIDLADELDLPVPEFLDLRDRAGWSKQADNVAPKMAALVAEALLPAAMTRTVDVVSQGVCLIAGAGAVILPLAEQLSETLTVTAVITDGEDPPLSREFDVVRGAVRRVSGALGGFEITIDALEQLNPGGRGAFTLTEPRDGAISACDIVVDLTGGAALVPAPDKREGYLRCDPRDPLAVSRLALEAIQLVGVFEKPLYVQLQDSLCAHSRAEQIGCSNCLDICPTGAITPNGDHVAIDPMICAGCGSCAAVCPSTAITYDDPPVAHLMMRLETLARSFRAAGGKAPRLLVHNAHGAEMIRLAARFGDGLPADVIPLELDVISGFGHAEMLAALANGFASVTVLLAPTTERDALQSELHLAMALANVSLSDGANPSAITLEMLDLTDPDALSAHLYAQTAPPVVAQPILPMGNRRQIARLSAQSLNPDATQPLPLPAGAPYGAVLVDSDACTLCLSCVSLCPSGALIDNPDLPQLRFQEDACLQCGLCATICPETAITLEPRMDTSDAALGQIILNQEDPFACIECGSLFGVKSTVEKVMEKLAGVHPMFASSAQARMIQMCDNCRVNAQFHSDDNPFASGERPRVRTSDDYFSDRKDH